MGSNEAPHYAVFTTFLLLPASWIHLHPHRANIRSLRFSLKTTDEESNTYNAICRIVLLCTLNYFSDLPELTQQNET